MAPFRASNEAMPRDSLLRVLNLVPMILSLSVHEWAHAASAYKLGDDTAARQGRLTLNPLSHIDLIGTLLLPLLGVPFGWAKPVPVNPANFKRSVSMRTGMALTAAAGPASNFALAVLCALGLGLWLRSNPTAAVAGGAVTTLLFFSLKLNVSLGLFNLLPVPPLDGSRIASRYLGERFPALWSYVEQYSTYLIIGVFAFGAQILALPLAIVNSWLFSLVTKIAFGGS
jgi:Zn-dependent protease